MSFKSSAKRKLLAGSAAAALILSLSQAALAQDADLEDEDVVVSTGIRQSIKDSLALKKDSSSIIEAVTAEDIGKLPDISIADTLARLPGVTAQRVRGRAQAISIRGFGPDFSVALLNGREQVSAGNNRGIEFDQFPSELIAKGLVYKTPDAALAAIGIAGAVDLQTVKPLDYSDRQFNVSGKYVINDNGDLNPDFGADGYRLFGSYIDQNADGTIGWSVGVTHQSNPTQFFSRELKTNQFQVGATEDGVVFPTDNPRSGVVSRDFERTSIAGALQFEPTDRFAATLDAYYSDYEDTGIFRGVETPLASWSGAEVGQVNGSGPFATSATYNNVGPILRTDTEGNTAEIFAIGLNTTYDVSDRFRVMGDLSYSELDRNDIDYESYAGTGTGIIGSGNADVLDTLTFTFPEEGDYTINAGRDYTDPNTVLLADPGGWGQVGFIKEPEIGDELTAIRLEAEYDIELDWVESIRAGAIITNREKSFNSNEAFLRAGTGFNEDREAPIPADSIEGATDSGSIGLDILAYDPASLIDNGTYVVDPANSTAWTVEEDIVKYFAMANVGFNIGDMPVTGNIGVQVQDVEQESTGTLAFPEGAPSQEQTVTETYTEVLPSLNLSVEVVDNTYVRFAAAETISRPRLDQLAANQGFGFNNTVCPDEDGDGVREYNAEAFNPGAGQVCLGFGGGNPFLRPYQAESYDFAVQHFFSDTGELSLAVFHKDLSDYVIGGSTVVTSEEQAVNILGQAFVDANPTSAVTTVGAPGNFQSGDVTGFEGNLRFPLEALVDSLEGFGINANYSYTKSEIEDENGRSIRIPGYSENVASGGVYYEANGLQARVNVRYRDGFLSEVQEFDGSLNGAEALSETLVDAQIGYEFQSGALEGFSVNIEGYNLTDEPFRTENDLVDFPGETFVSRYETYGRTFNFTVAKKF